MENWLIASWEILFKTGLSVVGIFIVMIVIMRISGLRTFAKMSGIDFASTIAIGSILAAVIMNTGQSLIKGLVALTTVVLFQALYTVIYRKSDAADKIFTNSPLLLMKDGQVLHENLTKSNVALSDLMAKLREANVHQLKEVNAVVLETTGGVSVLHSKEDKDIDDVIMAGVQKDS